MSNFSEVFSELVSESGLSLLALEHKLGISNAQLGKYQIGYYMPSLENAVKIADYFKCSIDYLCGLDINRISQKIVCSLNVEKFLTRYATLIEENNIKESVMAKEMGFARNRPLFWRKNKIFPTLPILVKLSKCLNVSIEYLIGRTNSY